jgi:ketosteroid isomerase-like protein
MVDRRRALDWIATYEDAWRNPDVGALAGVFTPDVRYTQSPWAEPLVGLDELGRFWESARAGSDEAFRMTSEVVAFEGPTAVIRVHVDYGDGERWRDLWIVTFDDDGRCAACEEWPFSPTQPDGH